MLFVRVLYEILRHVLARILELGQLLALGKNRETVTKQWAPRQTTVVLRVKMDAGVLELPC